MDLSRWYSRCVTFVGNIYSLEILNIIFCDITSRNCEIYKFDTIIEEVEIVEGKKESFIRYDLWYN